jgi:hypothetical protein
MSPWTALLQSLHSALIDELTDRHPEPKPELGMPLRQRAFAFPSSDFPVVLLCEVTFSLGDGTESRGFTLFGLDPVSSRKLGLDTPATWAALVKRAGGEFMHHKIRPKFGTLVELHNTGGAVELPKGFPPPERVVWVPFKLNPGVCYLGVGA